MTAFPDWRDNGGGGVTTNVLSLIGANLKSIVDGVQSNTVVIPSGGATTNSLVNNGDNTLTSDVNGQSSTADILPSMALHAGEFLTNDGSTASWVPNTGGSGTVTEVSVAADNGFTAVVYSPNTTPDIHIQTYITGILKGNGVGLVTADPADIITSNELTLEGSLLTSLVDGITSNSIDLSPIIPPTTTNTLVNNGNNTLTSTVNSVASTDNIIDTNGISRFANAFSTQVNGLDSGPVSIIDTVTLALTGSDLTAEVNGIISSPVDLSPIIPPTTTNTLINNGNNTLTSTVDGVASTDNIIDTNGVARDGPNAFSTQVNGLDSGPLDIIDTTALVLTGNLLKTTINSLDSNTVDIQVPITSPTNNNLVSMDATGHVKDAAVQVTTSSASNDNTHIPTSAAVQTNLALKANLVSPAFTGAPTAPTQTQGDNSTKLATTAYVDAGLISTGVTSFNTRTGAVVPVSGDYGVAQVTGAASTASPTFTGTVTMPTPVNATDAATKGYVDTGLAGKINSTSGTAIQKANGSGGLTAATAGTDYQGLIASPTLDNLVSMTATGVIKDSALGVTHSSVSNSPNLIMAADAVATALATKAPLASPTFTGTPAAPTAAPGTNSTQLATTAFAAAALALKADLASPPLTGNPTAPTQLTADNSTRLATTAYVTAKVAATTNTLAIANTTLSSVVNGITATAQVAPSAQSPTSSITFTNLDEIILLIAPSVNAIGFYTLQLKGTGQELNILFSINGNSNTKYNYSTINILEVTDTTGNITTSNISNFILFRGYVRNTAPNSYFAVTFSMPNQLIYTNPLSMTLSQSGLSYLNENATITSMITTSISNLVSLASADLIFKMKVNIVAMSSSNPQGYLYAPGSSSSAIFQNSINPVTGAATALTPASLATTNPYKISATTLRNYVYGVVASGTNVYMFRVSPTNGTLSALSPATVVGPSTCTGIVVDPTDRFVYACSFGGPFAQWSITKATGQLVAIPSPPAGAAQMQDLAVHPSGKYLYGISNGTGLVYQYSITQAAGASQGGLVALSTLTIAAGTGPLKIIVHPSGLFAYVVNNNGGGAGTISVFTIDPTTGQLTLASTFTPASAGNLQGACISNNGLFICYTSQNSNLVASSSLNQATGAISTLLSSQGVPGARDCCFDFSGAFLYVVNDTNNRIDGQNFNQTTGVITTGTNVASGVNVNNIIAI